VVAEVAAQQGDTSVVLGDVAEVVVLAVFVTASD
jgi:hypothetical protein